MNHIAYTYCDVWISSMQVYEFDENSNNTNGAMGKYERSGR
jgi:hypothetical protein